MNHKFAKAERLSSMLTIDKLFAGGNASMVAFPLRIVYMKVRDDEAGKTSGAERVGGAEPPVSVLVSVPKKRFRHAVDRNRMKRLVREAYRINKHILWDALEGKNYKLAVAFVCITDQMPVFYTVRKSMVKALTQMSERLNR